MRISDWSSDVCSSDLVPGLPWITLSKFVLIATLLSFGVVLATDRNARSTLGGAFREGRPALVFLVTFVIVQFATSFFSDTIGETLGQVTNMQQIGRAHVRTPVTKSHLVCRLLLEKNKQRT